MNPERAQQIRDLISRGLSRQQVAEQLGISVATVDRARVGMAKLPRGGRREGTGRPRTGRVLLRKAVDPDLAEWLEGKEVGYLNRLLRMEKQFEAARKPGASENLPKVVCISREDGQHRSLNCRVVEWIREDSKDRGHFALQLNLLVEESDQFRSWMDFL